MLTSKATSRIGKLKANFGIHRYIQHYRCCNALLHIQLDDDSGAPNENIVQNHLNIELLNVF